MLLLLFDTKILPNLSEVPQIPTFKHLTCRFSHTTMRWNLLRKVTCGLLYHAESVQITLHAFDTTLKSVFSERCCCCASWSRIGHGRNPSNAIMNQRQEAVVKDVPQTINPKPDMAAISASTHLVRPTYLVGGWAVAAQSPHEVPKLPQLRAPEGT